MKFLLSVRYNIYLDFVLWFRSIFGYWNLGVIFSYSFDYQKHRAEQEGELLLFENGS